MLLLTYRYLDPVTGRFLTRDPIGMDGGVNLYAYVWNAVVVLTDPVGLAGNPLNDIWKCAQDCYLKSDPDEFQKCFIKCMGKKFTSDLCVAYGCYIPWHRLPPIVNYHGCPSYGNPCAPWNVYHSPRGQCVDCADLKRACCVLLARNLLDVRKCNIQWEKQCSECAHKK